MAKLKSRLKETDFSKFNLRDAYITDVVEYLGCCRDESLFSNYSIKALIKIPKIENNVDEEFLLEDSDSILLDTQYQEDEEINLIIDNNDKIEGFELLKIPNTLVH